MSGVEAEDKGELPRFVVKRKPWIFGGQEEFLAFMINTLSRLSDLDVKMKEGAHGLNVDMVEVIAIGATSAGLRASNADDLRYTSLLILYSRHRGAGTFAAFYADCLTRALDGRSTVLRHYREDRTPYRQQVWYQFVD